MRIEYNEDGSMSIHLETIEDRIIFNMHHTLNESDTLEFRRINNSVLTCEIKKNLVNPAMPTVHADLTLVQNKEIVSYIKDGMKLMAVKALKDYTGLGLRESKEAVDLFCRLNPKL